ncbi:MAG: hypothetical protein ACYC6N_08175 [Pirellulaceae bacterium]
MGHRAFLRFSRAIFLSVLVAIACGSAANGDEQSETRGGPSAAGESGGPFFICAAGVPHALFGPEDAPRFEEVFTDLQAHGFTAYFPDFSRRETGSDIQVYSEGDYFYDLDPDSPRYAAGPHSPYQAARGKVQILFPGYAFVSEQEWAEGIDEAKLRDTLIRFKERALAGDASVLAGIDNYDEPVSRITGCKWANAKAPVSHQTLHQFYRVSKSVFPNLPVYMVEGCVATAVDHLASYSEYLIPRPAVKKEFWEDVERSAKAADWYGFDLYPVPQLENLALVGDNVRAARKHAPGKKILAVLQGFGEDDLGRTGRRPTPEETRFMAYDAIINGADGIAWWGQSAMDISKDDTLWQAVKATAKEIRALDAIRELSTIDLAYANSKIETLARRGEDIAYVLAANTSGQSQPFAFLIPFPADEDSHAKSYQLADFHSGETLGSGPVERGNRPIVTETMGLAKGVWREQLPPHGVRVYLITYSG